MKKFVVWKLVPKTTNNKFSDNFGVVGSENKKLFPKGSDSFFWLPKVGFCMVLYTSQHDSPCPKRPNPHSALTRDGFVAGVDSSVNMSESSEILPNSCWTRCGRKKHGTTPRLSGQKQKCQAKMIRRQHFTRQGGRYLKKKVLVLVKKNVCFSVLEKLKQSPYDWFPRKQWSESCSPPVSSFITGR